MKLKVLIVTILAMAFFGVVAFADYDPDNPGQIIDNPWADLFTTQATTEAPTETTTVEPSTETPTETTTVEPSTEAPTVEPTTESGDFDLTTLDPQGENKHFTVGNFGVYLAGTKGIVVDAGVDPNDDNHLRLYYRAAENRNDKWNFQPYIELNDLEANETYNVTWTLTSNSTKDIKSNFYNDGNSFPLNGGVNTLVGTKQADENGHLRIALGLCALSVGTTVDLTDLIITDSNGKQVYPKKEEPTTQEPTAEPTTQAPTQKPTKVPATTVAPTKLPNPIPVVKVPGKAKVKKATKKKSAKKIKIKLKKVKGAKGYQVAIYKTKKKAKKNKKALVKKYVKNKKKVTIKSKKLKKKKKLFVKARAFTLDGTLKVFGPWSKVKKAKIKK